MNWGLSYIFHMLDFILDLSGSKYSLFLSNGYSLELYLRLKQSRNGMGIEELYNSLKSPKPKQQSFDRFIRLLDAKGLIEITIGLDKRKKNINLK